MNGYKEMQKFNSPLIWGILLILTAGGVFAALAPVHSGDKVEIITLLGIFTAVIVFFLIFTTGYLKTAIDQSGVKIEMRIVFRFGKTIRWEEVESVKVDKYRPIIEFGGWGYRIGWKAVAYNCRGNDGLIIILKNGRKVVVGTQKPEELKKFLAGNGKGIDEKYICNERN
jgi:hypothetical protein